MTVMVLVARPYWGGLNLLAPMLRAWSSGEEIDAAFLGVPTVRREMTHRAGDLRLAPGYEAVTDWTAERREELNRAVDVALDADAYDVILCGTSAHALLERVVLA